MRGPIDFAGLADVNLWRQNAQVFDGIVPVKVDCVCTVDLSAALRYRNAIKFAGMQKPFQCQHGIQRHRRDCMR